MHDLMAGNVIAKREEKERERDGVQKKKREMEQLKGSSKKASDEREHGDSDRQR